MQHRVSADDQLLLFSTQLRWKEFPQDVRQRACQLLAALCLEIVKDYPTYTEEQNHEPRADSILAP
jgi:hypothetical protein